jgi:hypothetical protein
MMTKLYVNDEITLFDSTKEKNSFQIAAPSLFRKSQREATGEGEGEAASAPRLILLPPSRASLLGLRGLLLHADYTRELADRRLTTGLRLCDADRVARYGIQNPDLYTKRVSKKIFDRWDLPRVSEKALALISSLSDSCIQYGIFCGSCRSSYFI